MAENRAEQNFSAISELLQKLQKDGDNVQTLNELKHILSQSSILGADIIEKVLGSPELFACFGENTTLANSAEHSAAYDVLLLCTANGLDLQRLENGGVNPLITALNHSNARIKALALSVILKQVRQPLTPAEQLLIVPESMMLQILDFIKHQNIEVGITAVAILSIVLVQRIEQYPVEHILDDMLQCTGIVKCRVYELAAELAKVSATALERFKFLLDHAVYDMRGEDIMLQVSILDIFNSLANVNFGLLYLERRQVLEIAINNTENVQKNGMGFLLLTAVMKFFGKWASLQPQKIITSQSQMITQIFERIHIADLSMLPAAYDTLANLAQSQQGKILLERHYAANVKQSLLDSATYLRSLPNDFKTYIFNTLAVMFCGENLTSRDVYEITYKWFNYLADGSNMQFLIDFCYHANAKIRIACLNFIRAVCFNDWGVAVLKNTPDLVAYMLERNPDFDKETQHAKFTIIVSLAQSKAFDEQEQLAFFKYINKGPFHNPGPQISNQNRRQEPPLVVDVSGA